MPRSSVSIVFAGSGGTGAMTAGEILIRAVASCGYYGLMTQLFGAQVRGGETAALLELSEKPVICQPDRFDIFVALDFEKLEQFAAEIPLDEGSTILFDPGAGKIPAALTKAGARSLPISMMTKAETPLARALGGKHVNIFAVGMIGTLLGLPGDALERALEEVLGGHSEKMVRTNSNALQEGITAATGINLNIALAPAHRATRWLVSGNQAIGMGSLRGGVRFVGCYPITPATDLVEWLAPRLRDLGGRLVLGEDELASINLVLGASFGGVPAMTVTSGPGLSLMAETIGLGIAAEVPAVIIDVMRAGPSTGIPSKTEQSDLNLAIGGSHGDAPRIVLAPTSVRDCMFTSEWAVYLAEAYQSPVIVLSDQALGLSLSVVDPKMERPTPLRRKTEFDPKNFKRYAIGANPITPMPIPGTPGGHWVGDGLTHNELGVPVSGAAAHVEQMDKRARKIASFDPGVLWGETHGDGETAILTFGSGIGPALEAAHRMRKLGAEVRVISLRVLAPLPIRELTEALDGVRRLVVMEQNHGGQLYRHLLASKAVPHFAESFARPGPLPFRPAEIISHLS